MEPKYWSRAQDLGRRIEYEVVHPSVQAGAFSGRGRITEYGGLSRKGVDWNGLSQEYCVCAQRYRYNENGLVRDQFDSKA